MKFDFSALAKNNELQVANEPKVVEVASQNTAVEKTMVDNNTRTNETLAIQTPVAKKEIMNSVMESNSVIVDSIDNDILEMSPAALNKYKNTVVKKFNAIVSELNSQFIERENEISMLTLALLSGTNAFLHGPAGTGKSQLTEEFSNRIVNSEYFRVLMGKTTEPAEVFGPVSINALKNDSYKVNTENKLPRAHIAFLDEVFKANSAVLNNLLTIMNEKLFFNDVVEEVPLISVIGASNEYIEDDSLIALYDRFLCRWHVDYIQDAGKRMDLFKSFLSSREKKSAFNTVAATTKVVTTVDVQELLVANELCKEIKIDMKTLKEYNKLFMVLEKKGIVISDRRKNEALKIVQASAFLNGKTEADIEDFEPLRYVLWNTQDQIQDVAEEINKLANPHAVKYDQIKATIDGFRNELEELEETKGSVDYAIDRSVKMSEINTSLKFAQDTVNKEMKKMAPGSKFGKKFMELEKEIAAFLDEVRTEILV